LEQLREDLWNRWQDCFNRFHEVAQASQFGERTVYANRSLFPLKDYTPQKFPAGGRVFPSPPESINSYHEYRLDSTGRPVYMASGHTVNHFDWRGLYRYSAEEVEYVEFCVQTQVVSVFARMTLRDGLPHTFQKFEVNGGGSHLGGRMGTGAIGYILQNPQNRWAQILIYDALENRISSARTLEQAGEYSFRAKLAYSYSDSGKLERIDRVREDGSKATEFAARTKVGMSGLTAKLSEKIALKTIEALSAIDFDAPLQTVEMSFRSVTNYIPCVIPATELDSITDMGHVLSIDQGRWISLKAEDFEPEMADLAGRMDAAESWEPGSKMLRQAALMVTRLAPDSLKVAEGFVAFAIDWEFEGQELITILKKCGATAATFRKLRSIGWLE